MTKQSTTVFCYLFLRPITEKVMTGCKQNMNFRPKGEDRSGRRPLLPTGKLNILVDLMLGKSYHSVVTFLHAQKIMCYTFSIQTSLKLIFIRQCRNRVAKYFVEWRVPGLTEICTNQRTKMPRKVVTTSSEEKCFV